MVKPRDRAAAIEQFAARAERATPAAPALPPRDEPAWKQRNREPKNVGIMIRASESQLELLRAAAVDQEMSQQKVLERILWPILEERYGAGATAQD